MGHRANMEGRTARELRYSQFIQLRKEDSANMEIDQNEVLIRVVRLKPPYVAAVLGNWHVGNLTALSPY